MFDPDSSKDAMLRGFTSCDPDDLPIDLPSRALSDNLRNEKDVTGKLRDEIFAGLQNDERVRAYKEVQFGVKAGECDAEEYDDIVGDYEKNGQY